MPVSGRYKEIGVPFVVLPCVGIYCCCMSGRLQRYVRRFIFVLFLCRYGGVSTCFRKEAGAHGKDTWGIFRVHQFEKVEQFCICEGDLEKSAAMQEEMVSVSWYWGLGFPAGGMLTRSSVCVNMQEREEGELGSKSVAMRKKLLS